MGIEYTPKTLGKRREELVTRGWRRLREVVKSQVPLVEYPLAEILARA